jgi:hypothetical protein
MQGSIDTDWKPITCPNKKGVAVMLNKLFGALAIVVFTAGLASANLDGYMESLRISADADFGDFRAGLGMHFGASGAELDHVFLAVGHPSEAALCFWLARTSGKPMDVVLQQYRAHGKKGWGALAQSLGIKPGSAEFKALKAGQIGWNPPAKKGKAKGGNDHKSAEDKGTNNKGKKN